MKAFIFLLSACLLATGCSSMSFFDTMSVVSEAYEIKECREAVAPAGDRWAYAACEGRDY